MIMTAEEYIENNLIDSDYFKGYLYEEEIYDVMYVFCRKDVGLVTKSTCRVECRSSRAFV